MGRGGMAGCRAEAGGRATRPAQGPLGASGGAVAWMDRGGAGGRLGALRALPGRCMQCPGGGSAHHAGIKNRQAGRLAVGRAGRLAVGRAGLVDYRLMPYVYPYIMSGCVIDWVNIVVKHCSATFPGAAFG